MSEPAKKNGERDAQPEPQDLETAIRRRVLNRDKRYHINAYRFIYEALEHTQKLLGRRPDSDNPEDRHVTGQELLEGIRDCAQRAFGPLAPCVFRSWGVRRTEDFGEIVFSLVEAGLMGKTDRDSRADFANGYDFDAAFDGPLKIK
ncbi:MAG TPA: hypothetical protein P5137_18400 [Candidatus Brocadiia bacterium]|nr:hypothetical protein [Candidatus Brocadiia bacterium]